MKFIYKNFKQTRNLNGETFNKGLFTFLTMLLNKVQLSIKPGLLLGVIFVLFTGATYAQELEWAIQSKSSGAFVFSQDIAVDGTGNSYVTGSFSHTTTFGVGEPNETSLTNIDESPTQEVEMDIFVAKYNVEGILQWVRQVGGSSYDSSAGIAVDDVGNSYVTGDFFGTANFGVGRSTKSTLTANGSNDIFVAKYSADGILLWVKQAGGSGADFSRGIAVDGVGNTYLTGWFHDAATFGAGDPAETTLTPGRSQADLFVAKYDSDGILRWANQTVGSLESFETLGLDIAVDGAGNSYVTGTIQGTVTFGTGEPKEIALTSTGNDIFVAKYDPDGRLQWAKQAVGTDYSAGDVSVDAAGNSYVTGDVFGTATFGVGEPNETTLTNSFPSSDSFVAKYTPDGTLRWAMLVNGGPDGDIGINSIAVDGAGNSYVTGSFSDTAIFGAGEPNETTLTTGSFFVAKYGPDATLQWAKQDKGSGSTGVGIAVDSAGSSYVTGSFSGTAIYGVGEPNETTLTASGVYGMLFVAKYTDSAVPSETIDIQVNSSIDVAEEFPSGRVSLTSRDLELVDDRGRNQTVGIRFNQVIIPPGATINKAYLQFQVEGENVGSTSLTIKGHAVDDATTFTKTLHDISSRPQTKALANWNPAPWSVLGESDSAQRTPNIASIIQEITKRPGWSSGNSVAFMITGTGERSAESFDGDLKGAPLLHVEFSLP